MHTLTSGIVAAILAAALLDPSRAAAASCEALSSLTLPNTTITLAQQVAAGPFKPQGAERPGRSAASPLDLPSFCRVAAALKPSSDSDIRIEVWLPIDGWNGKLQAVGNGGWNGAIAFPALAEALRRGYATTSTDTGHEGATASFALGHPEKLIDFAYRSEHEMTVVAKAIIGAFYGRPPVHSYWNGCSAGGRQALKEAQRFPGDFDGIIAGAPGSDWSGRSAQSMRIAQAMHRSDESYIPPEKYAAIHRAAIEACDALDGLKDRLLQDPTRCSFDPAVLECKGPDSPSCLTPPQVQTARAVYATTRNPKTGRELTGLFPGSELGWATWGGPAPLSMGLDHFRYIVFKDPAWDYHTFDFDAGIVLAEQMDNGLINALDPKLTPFFARGGKLLQYHGWADPQISPGASVQYYQSVVHAAGDAAAVQASYRLFMVPGMAHCGGGEGPNTFDMVSALEEWVEKGNAPDRIVASHLTGGTVDRTRPLCPYPQLAKYTGTGSSEEAANFVCTPP